MSLTGTGRVLLCSHGSPVYVYVEHLRDLQSAMIMYYLMHDRKCQVQVKCHVLSCSCLLIAGRHNIYLKTNQVNSLLAFFHFIYVRTSGITVKGSEMPFTHSTYTFTLEWVQEVPAHFSIISRRSRWVVHAPHVIGRVLEREKVKYCVLQTSSLQCRK